MKSRLYSIEPIGIRTKFTESISSYLIRLSEEHCVAPKHLILKEIVPYVYRNENIDTTGVKSISNFLSHSNSQPAINGMKDKTETIINALEALTLQKDLKYLSCLAWKGVIKDGNLFRRSKAWCPCCFEQWKQEQKPIYEPLIWSFKDVQFCTQHFCKLVFQCPHCKSQLKAIANKARIGFCYHCGKWLGQEKSENKEIIDNLEEHLYISMGIGKLISIVPDLQFPLILSNLIKKLQLIHFYFELYSAKNYRTIGLTQNMYRIRMQLRILTMRNSNRPINLIDLIIPCCRHANLDIADFFNENLDSLGRLIAKSLDVFPDKFHLYTNINLEHVPGDVYIPGRFVWSIDGVEVDMPKYL
ncbi:MAG: TniQ family protein [Cyanobacteria bacterium J06621_15]